MGTPNDRFSFVNPESRRHLKSASSSPVLDRPGPSYTSCLLFFQYFIDRGCGTPKEQLAKIGSPFYTTKENGTGLGMMISFNIMNNIKVV
ncbi:ATP-binding protein [Aneurinibacillus terranovensis]|uniref:ATP-binding protein n=1 Tax=Aneurinibacillus terranovensis TaxID=278991 RepID=UPI00316ACE8F